IRKISLSKVANYIGIFQVSLTVVLVATLIMLQKNVHSNNKEDLARIPNYTISINLPSIDLVFLLDLVRLSPILSLPTKDVTTPRTGHALLHMLTLFDLNSLLRLHNPRPLPNIVLI